MTVQDLLNQLEKRYDDVRRIRLQLSQDVNLKRLPLPAQSAFCAERLEPVILDLAGACDELWVGLRRSMG